MLPRHHIENAFIAVVSYSCNDWQREICHILSKSQSIEAAKVGSSTTTAYYDNHIKFLIIIVYGIESCNNRIFNHLALHHCRKQTCMKLEAIRIVGKLITKITMLIAEINAPIGGICEIYRIWSYYTPIAACWKVPKLNFL